MAIKKFEDYYSKTGLRRLGLIPMYPDRPDEYWYNKAGHDFGLYKIEYTKPSKYITRNQLQAFEKEINTRKQERTCNVCGHEYSEIYNYKYGCYIYNYGDKNICRNCIRYIESDLSWNKGFDNLKNIMEHKENYVLVHFETTGVNYEDEVIAASAINFKGDILLDCLVKPSVKFTEGAIGAHGITPEIITEKGIDAATFKIKLQEIIKDKTIIIYNVGFYLDMLLNNFKNAGLDCNFLQEASIICFRTNIIKEFWTKEELRKDSYYWPSVHHLYGYSTSPVVYEELEKTHSRALQGCFRMKIWLEDESTNKQHRDVYNPYMRKEASEDIDKLIEKVIQDLTEEPCVKQESSREEFCNDFTEEEANFDDIPF